MSSPNGLAKLRALTLSDDPFLPNILQTLFNSGSLQKNLNFAHSLKLPQSTNPFRSREKVQRLKKNITREADCFIEDLVFEKEDHVYVEEYLSLGFSSNLINLSFIGVRILLSDIEVISNLLKRQGCKLKNLLFSTNNFSSKAVEYLCPGLARNKSLLSLALDHNGLTNKDIYHLKDAFLTRRLHTPALELLSLSNNDIDDAGIESLSRALKYLKVRRLDLSCNNLSRYSIYYLKDVGLNLLHIDLSYNLKLGVCGFVGLVDIYQISTTLSWINLSGLSLGGDLIVELLAHLKSHQCRIERLGLSDNQLDDKFGVELAVALAINTSLVELDLSRNLFTNVCIRHLALCLQFNRHLVSLHLNQISEDIAPSTALVLIRAIRTSMRITTLSIDLSQEDLAQRLKKSLAFNRKLYERVASDAFRFLGLSRLLLHSLPSQDLQPVNIGDLPFELIFLILKYIVVLRPPSLLSYTQVEAIVEYAIQKPPVSWGFESKLSLSHCDPRELFLCKVGCLRPNRQLALSMKQLLVV